MSNRRLARLNEQIRREVSEILRTRVSDPRVGVPTVTGVAVTHDLWLARIFVRPDPTQGSGDIPGMLEGLGHAAPFIRRELGRTLSVRRVPELRFEPDTTLEKALRIEKLLREVLPPESAPGAGAGTGAEGDGNPASGGVSEDDVDSDADDRTDTDAESVGEEGGEEDGESEVEVRES